MPSDDRTANQKLATVSIRARKLYARIVAGHWYGFGTGTDHRPTPKAMKELEDAGLVIIGGRVRAIALAYVPVEGYEPFVMEDWDGKTNSTQE